MRMKKGRLVPAGGLLAPVIQSVVVHLLSTSLIDVAGSPQL